MTKPPVTELQIKRFCERTIRNIQKVLGLKHYNIEILYRYQKKVKGWCKVLAEYEKATININLERAKTLHDLQNTCLHEVIHIMNAKQDRLAWDLAVHYDDGESKVMQKQLVREIEAVTTQLTRVLYPLVFDD